MSTLTVLRTRGPLLAKQWLATGTIKDYDSAKQYTFEQVPCSNIHTLHQLLETIRSDARKCLIRGQPRAGVAPGQVVQRNLLTFGDAPSNLFMLDIDGFESLLYDKPWLHPEDVVHEYIATLPECFQGVACVLQLSGSAGHPSKKGLRAHLWYWLASPMRCDAAEHWCAQVLGAATDKTVQRVVQVNYTADPVMFEGLVDPVPRRLLFVDGLLADTLDLSGVAVPVPVPMAAKKGRAELVDPREKTGTVGALCRAFSPEEIVDLFPEHFEAGHTEQRITWLQGGGSREGVCVSDSGTHLFNSQNTAPVTYACNLFDFIRIHVYGHLDNGIAEDAKFDVTALPSFDATLTWALSRPEVQAELGSDTAVEKIEAALDTKAENALAARGESLQRMQRVLAGVLAAADVYTLEHDLGRRVSKADISSSEREQIGQAMQRRSADLLGGRGLPISVVREWLTPARTGGATFPDLNRDGEPLCTIGNVAALCAQLGVTIRYNVISKRQEILGPECAFSIDNYDNASLSWLQSECAKASIPYNLGTLRGYVTVLADCNQYNPVLTWVESLPWDGIDRLEQLYATVVAESNFDAGLKNKMLRRWLVQAIAAAASPKALQLRGVLVVQGAQYMGKSRWLQSLVGGNDDLVVLGRTLDAHNKDSVKTAISHWLAEFGELDGTFTKSDLAALKAFIAQDTDTMRLPYAVADSKYQRRTVFYGSVNSDEFLNDDTGNTRFWVIPAVSMQHDHKVNMQQLWAQVLQLWRGGEPHWMDVGDMAAVSQSGERFALTNPVRDRIDAKFAWHEARVNPESVVWVWLNATEICRRIGIEWPNMSQTSTAGRYVKKLNNGRYRVTSATRTTAVPYASDSEALADT